jgi:hypothetical protein
MNLKELIAQREGYGYRLKCLSLKLKELRESYYPSRGENIGGGHCASNTSPQEKLILRMDAVLTEMQDIQDKIDEIDAQIDVKLLMITNPKHRWIVLQRIRGIGWKEIDCYGLSLSRAKHIFKDASLELGIAVEE